MINNDAGGVERTRQQDHVHLSGYMDSTTALVLSISLTSGAQHRATHTYNVCPFSCTLMEHSDQVKQEQQ